MRASAAALSNNVRLGQTNALGDFLVDNRTGKRVYIMLVLPRQDGSQACQEHGQSYLLFARGQNCLATSSVRWGQPLPTSIDEMTLSTATPRCVLNATAATAQGSVE